MIWRLRVELPIEQVSGDRLIVVAHRGALEPLPRPRFEAVFLHQTNDPFPADAFLVILEQVPVNPWASVPAFAR